MFFLHVFFLIFTGVFVVLCVIFLFFLGEGGMYTWEHVIFFTKNNFISVKLAIVKESAKRSNALNMDEKDIFRET